MFAYTSTQNVLVICLVVFFLVTISTPSFPTVSQSGEVLVTGAGDVGQLGLGSDVLEKSRPALVILNKEIVNVCAGGMHTVCLTKDGKVCVFF